jgi:hypothetical protein
VSETDGLFREARRKLRPVRAALRKISSAFLRERARRRFAAQDRPQPHGLPGPLVVSLTSYPPRFPTLRPTLECLLRQSVRADHTVLWVANSDLESLPLDVIELEGHGLTIETCADIGPFKKLIPALRRWPDAFICTADDDAFYHRTWLAELVSHWAPHEAAIPCQLARRVAIDADGAPAAYAKWRHESGEGASTFTFPIGLGGVLYPPGSLTSEATDAKLFTSLCPKSDDAWAYWMAQRNGWKFHRIGRRWFVCWAGSQEIALQHDNMPIGNDLQIARLKARFGFPPAPPARWRSEAAREAESVRSGTAGVRGQ